MHPCRLYRWRKHDHWHNPDGIHDRYVIKWLISWVQMSYIVDIQYKQIRLYRTFWRIVLKNHLNFFFSSTKNMMQSCSWMWLGSGDELKKLLLNQWGFFFTAQCSPWTVYFNSMDRCWKVQMTILQSDSVQENISTKK